MVILLICAMLTTIVSTVSGVFAFRELYNLIDVESQEEYDRGFNFIYLSIVGMLVSVSLLLVCIFLYEGVMITELYSPEIK
jgi:hypothetical protein